MRKNKAFTLIELLAVIVILAIIALIATPIILGIVEDTRKEAFLRDAEMIEHAAELYVTNELGGNVDKEVIIPMSELNKYVTNITEDKLDKNVVVSNKNGVLSYHYTGRDTNPYEDYKTLKEVIESDTSHIVKNTKVNGVVVNKVIGTKSTKYTQKNYVWYSGQLWQVLETNDNNNSIFR